MIVKKDKQWHRLPRTIHRLESVAVSRSDIDFYHDVLIISRAEFMKLDPEVTGFPLKCTLDDQNRIGLWPKPTNYFELAITGSEIFQL